MEADKRVCKTCKVEKIRILVGKYNTKDKKYIDETGKAWNGSNCASCHKEVVRQRMKAMRALKKGLSDGESSSS